MLNHYAFAGWILLELVGLAVVIGIAVWGFIFWDRRYHGAAGSEGFEPTDEKFVDPTTGRMMRVYFNPRTGERQYRDA